MLVSSEITFAVPLIKMYCDGLSVPSQLIRKKLQAKGKKEVWSIRVQTR